MSSVRSPALHPVSTASFVLPLFGATLFASAFLLFGVQPMFTKMILPVLGGSPAVWSVAMVFFQAALLAGYLYAHLLVRFLPVRIAAILHVALMAAALAATPIGVAGGWGRPPAHQEALWLIGLFGASVGLPFFAVAANGPLLQAWFARSGHPSAQDPYFLYGASNLGSFVALLSYPVLIEPLLPLGDQSRSWSVAFVLLAAMIGLCALAVPGGRVAGGQGAPRADHLSPATPARRRLAWVALAAVPSGLLVSVTAHVSTDVAAAPLLWVAPLALFLLTFILTFKDRPLLSDSLLAGAQVWGTALVLLAPVLRWPLGVTLGLHLGLFFVNALVCHGALYRLRPDRARLTEFYLFLSLGGVVGGVACSLVAPAVFSTVLEYPILLVLALACRPGIAASLPALRSSWLRVGAGALAVGCLLVLTNSLGSSAWTVAVAVLAVGLILSWRRSDLALAAAAALALVVLVPPADGVTTTAYRSFFGVHRTTDLGEGRFRILMHGTTVHGAQRLRNDDGTPASGRPETLTYYTPEGGYGRTLAALRDVQGGRLRPVAVAGLGAGVIACHSAAGERWDFFEIDPVVVGLARDPAKFSFLRDCTPDAPVRLGDARLTLSDEPGQYGLIILDAFSSDAIPAHLLTREAISLYLSKLDATGAIIFHITNRHLELRNILARTAAEHGLVTYVMAEGPVEEPLERRLRAPTKIAVVARDPGHLGAIATGGPWTRVQPDMSRRPWTDDYSNILGALMDAR